MSRTIEELKPTTIPLPRERAHLPRLFIEMIRSPNLQSQTILPATMESAGKHPHRTSWVRAPYTLQTSLLPHCSSPSG